MSADNGYILRKDTYKGKYILQMYFASDDSFPDIKDAKPEEEFDSIEAAIKHYNVVDSGADGYPSEYGLRTLL